MNLCSLNEMANSLAATMDDHCKILNNGLVYRSEDQVSVIQAVQPIDNLEKQFVAVYVCGYMESIHRDGDEFLVEHFACCIHGAAVEHISVFVVSQQFLGQFYHLVKVVVALRLLYADFVKACIQAVELDIQIQQIRIAVNVLGTVFVANSPP